ncbi:MAG: hypothetical protein WB495_19540 [Xanthobacteraceae bacterium]|jgi:hypothetical protein
MSKKPSKSNGPAKLLISPEQMLTIARSGDHFTFFTGLFRGKGPLQGQSGTSI